MKKKQVTFFLINLVFCPNNSCENKLLSIAHCSIYAEFDRSPPLEVRANFVHKWKAFYKVWHEWLVCKLESARISGELHKLFQCFFSNRFQAVVLNGQSSTWLSVLVGLPQGSALEPLLFLKCINDLLKNLESLTKLFADNILLFSIVNNSLLFYIMNNIIKVSEWAYQWKMSINIGLTKQSQKVFIPWKCKKLGNSTIYLNDALNASHSKWYSMF